MGRKRKISPIEDLIELTARFPWWIGVVLAIVAYPVLHYFATREIVAPKNIQKVGEAVTGQVWRMLALFGQYVLPIAFLAGAIISAITRYRRNGLVDLVAEAPHTGVLNEMTWQEFETLVAEGFKLKGYAVTARGGYTADGGVDVVLRKGTEKALVQCKQWRAMKVPVMDRGFSPCSTRCAVRVRLLMRGLTR